MDMGLAGKTALVLGAGGGLGCAIASSLAREGANIAVADINEEALMRTVESVQKAGGTALPLLWDIGDLSVVDARILEIESRFGGVDVLINNTGGPPPTTAFGQDAALWTRSFQTMVLSVLAITDRVLPGMRVKKWGRIITSTSSGDLQCAAFVPGRLVQDTGTGSGAGRHHVQHYLARQNCHRAHQVSR